MSPQQQQTATAAESGFSCETVSPSMLPGGGHGFGVRNKGEWKGAGRSGQAWWPEEEPALREGGQVMGTPPGDWREGPSR